jgi:hypothetical protein
VTVSRAELDALVGPLFAPDGWLPMALQRLEQDLLARLIETDARPAMARAARKAGKAVALRSRRRGWRSAEEALRAQGVDVRQSDAEAASGPFIHHALYTAPPPSVIVFTKTLDAVEQMLETTGLRARIGTVSVREVVLAHELFHHLARTVGVPGAVRPEVEVLRLGPWRRHAVVRAAEEIAAAGFAGAWCGVDRAPELLDCLTLAAYGPFTAPLVGVACVPPR